MKAELNFSGESAERRKGRTKPIVQCVIVPIECLEKVGPADFDANGLENNQAARSCIKGCVVGQMHRKINTAIKRKKRMHPPTRA